MWRRISAVVVVALMSGAFTAAFGQMDENQFVMRLRNAEAAMVGAAPPTKERIAEKLANELLDQSIHVASAVVVDFVHGNEGGSLRTGCFFVGISSPQNDLQSPWGQGDCYRPATELADIEWAKVTKSYQDRTFTYYVLLSSPDLVDNFRQGQKVTFSGTFVGMKTHGTSGWWGSDPKIKHYMGYMVEPIIVNASISTETHMLRCAKGHEYAPSAGYKFCPIDGLPLH